VLDQPHPARSAARLLDLDPDLADALSDEGRRLLAPFTVEVSYIDPGAWKPPRALAGRAPLGLLVVDGLLMRTLVMGARRAAELIGEGDIVRPWEDNDLIPPSATVAWHAFQPTRLALLDHRVAQLGRSLPALIEAIVGRCVSRSQMLSFKQIVASCPRAEQRVLLTFAVLARRWGRVRPGHIHLPLRLTHQNLADLVAARRPSVTSALGVLAAQGLVSRTPGGWAIATSVVDEDVPPNLAY
jgi:hypothetical protein